VTALFIDELKVKQSSSIGCYKEYHLNGLRSYPRSYHLLSSWKFFRLPKKNTLQTRKELEKPIKLVDFGVV